jgi:phospholipid transport system substrate-binding protein
MTRRHALFALLIAAAALAGAVPSRAAVALSPEQGSGFLDQTARQLLGVVNGGGDAKARQSAIEAIVDRALDTPAIAQFSLGRFWRTATPKQQAEYVEVFRRVLVANLMGKLGDYRGVTYELGQARKQGDDVMVSSIVTRPGNQPNKVDWLISGATGAPRIVDMVAEGTSLRLTQRSDYYAYLNSHGNDVQSLIDAMRQQVTHPAG